ncbi:hypothetical protein [Desulfotignum phosphitoxidans]|uniref:hypothetical protein n=1 Tax=Desulfotignum phosphitoxidans TaxID=190898 RepID=UPI00146CA2CC|nr:hypothetical protein [Desulfotignum phosphitoxidans]
MSDTWTGWKARTQLAPAPSDPDLTWLKRSLVRAAFISGPGEIGRLRRIIRRLSSKDVPGALDLAGEQANAIYYRLWGDKADRFGFAGLPDAFHRLTQNPSLLRDMDEILAWARDVSPVAGVLPDLPFSCSLEVPSSAPRISWPHLTGPPWSLPGRRAPACCISGISRPMPS